MKKDIAEYVAVCDVCQRVKIEHQKPAGFLQPLLIPEWNTTRKRPTNGAPVLPTNGALPVRH